MGANNREWLTPHFAHRVPSLYATECVCVWSVTLLDKGEGGHTQFCGTWCVSESGEMMRMGGGEGDGRERRQDGITYILMLRNCRPNL